MILENWQVKVLEDSLLNYEEWINHVQTVRKNFNGIEGDLMFPNPDYVVQNKIDFCFNKMVKEYGAIDESLTDEEKVNLIISKEGYMNRYERDNYKPLVDLEVLKVQRIKELETNNSARIYEIYPMHKQINISSRLNGYVDSDFDTMNEFITTRIYESRTIETQINACTSVEEVEAININLT